MIEEAVDAGITDIAIITGKHKQAIENHFKPIEKLEIALEKAGITVNKNTVPGETRSPFVTSGLRIGTPAVTTRGLKEKEIKQLTQWIVSVLKNTSEASQLSHIRREVEDLCVKFPYSSRFSLIG